MKKLIFATALCLWGTAAEAQSVRQSGNITPGHVATWATTGVIVDGGVPGGPIFTGSTTQNDFACVGTGSPAVIIDCGLSATGANAWTGLQNFNGGATTPTQAPGDNTTKVATDAFVTAAIAAQNRGGVRANLNNANWSFTTPMPNQYMLIPFGTTAFNLGSYYTPYTSYSSANPPTNGFFKPPAGTSLLCFGGSLLVDSGAKTTAANAVIKVIKDFVINTNGVLISGTDVVESAASQYDHNVGTVHFTLSGCDSPANSNEYYGLFLYIDGATGATGGDAIVVDGQTTHTSWSVAIQY